MPLYEYECKKCHNRVERIVKFSDPPLKKCPKCGGPVEQLISAPAVQFKGSGWYVTDYARKSGSAAPSNGDSGEKSEASKDEPSSRAQASKEGPSSKDTGKDGTAKGSTSKKESKSETSGKKKAFSDKK